MFRKLSVPGRRSSILTRLSVPNEIQDEKNGRRQSDGKKSFIPRPVPLRSSSAERDVGSTHKSRSASVESNADRDPKSVVRARSTENLTTPKNTVKTPVAGSRLSRATSTCKKSVRKDTRPLTDKGFQRIELSKVHEYLVNAGIIQPHQIREVQCPMTLKMFVHIMNSLLQKFNPFVNVNVGNYAEVIPNFMKKLKFPGTINRSSLVTANSPHSWPHVFGMISYFTHILSFDQELEYVQDDDGLEADQVKKLLSYTCESYLEWEERGVMRSPEDEQFFYELVQDKNEALDKETLYVQKEIESLLSLKSDINSPEEIASQEKLKSSHQFFTSMKAEINKLKVSLQNLTLGVKKGADELLTLQRDIANQKSNLSVSMKNQSEQKDSDARQITKEVIAKHQSEVVSLANNIKYQKTHVGEITAHCYNDDLALVRQRSLLDKTVLKREAVLRNCTSESLDTNKLQIKYNPSDADKIKNYIAYLQEIINSMNQNVFEHSNQEKEYNNKICQLSENIKSSNEILSKREAEMKFISEDMEQKKKKIRDLQCEMGGKLNEMQERNRQLQQEVEELEVLFSQLEKEDNLLERAFQNDYNKYKSIIDQCNEELQKQVEKCTELVRTVFHKK